MTRPVNADAHTSVANTRSLAPAPGVTPPRPEGPAHKFLSDALVERGHVTQAAMEAALHASRAGRRYSEVLVANGDISDDDLARTLADHYRIDHVNLDVFPVDIEIKRLVPMSAARRLGALPVALTPAGAVAVAVYDPESLTNMAEIAKHVGREVVPVVSSRSQVERHISTGVPAADNARAATPPAAVTTPPPARMAPLPQVAAPATPASAPAQRAVVAAAPPAPASPSSQTWAPAPGSAPQARVVAHVTVPPDPLRQAAVVGAEAPATAVRELEQRLVTAERRAQEAELRATTAERRAREASERAATAEQQARTADERIRAAEKQADGVSAAATAANEALAQLAQARLISDQTAAVDAQPAAPHSSDSEKGRGLRRMIAVLRRP